jgi:uncharacterized membrane protein
VSDSDTFTSAIETVGQAIDVLGMATIVIGILVATIILVTRHRAVDDAFAKYRQGIGRAILLGLRFLVAAYEPLAALTFDHNVS